MLFCFAVVAEPDAAKWPHRRPLADQEQGGAFGTGSWTDTSPRFGCCMATEAAIRELAANAAASNFSPYAFALIDHWFPNGNLLILLAVSSRPLVFSCQN
jgi:hypothetical protein